MTPAERQARRTDLRTFGQRLRRRRLESGLTTKAVADLAHISKACYEVYEVGSQSCPSIRLAAIASAMGVPIASLHVDELVLAEIRLSPETLERIRREGRPAAEAAIARVSDNLVALALAEATRPPVDLSPGARAKPRRSRESLLLNRARIDAAAEASREARREARKVA
jgi:transcriptional regulator with XRE-family HTH domain